MKEHTTDHAEVFMAVREQVLEAARGGIELDEIDARLIEPTELDDESKAALWIVAWHEIEYQRARYFARHIPRTAMPVAGTD